MGRRPGSRKLQEVKDHVVALLYPEAPAGFGFNKILQHLRDSHVSSDPTLLSRTLRELKDEGFLTQYQSGRGRSRPYRLTSRGERFFKEREELTSLLTSSLPHPDTLGRYTEREIVGRMIRLGAILLELIADACQRAADAQDALARMEGILPGISKTNPAIISLNETTRRLVVSYYYACSRPSKKLDKTKLRKIIFNLSRKFRFYDVPLDSSGRPTLESRIKNTGHS